jgi:hypothetical protein
MFNDKHAASGKPTCCTSVNKALLVPGRLHHYPNIALLTLGSLPRNTIKVC